MSGWIQSKVQLVCSRRGDPNSESSIRCDAQRSGAVRTIENSAGALAIRRRRPRPERSTMSAIDLGSALEELIRRIVREELSKLGGKPDEHEAAADEIAELVATDAAKLRAARARPAGVDGQPRPRRRSHGGV